MVYNNSRCLMWSDLMNNIVILNLVAMHSVGYNNKHILYNSI